MMPEKRKYLVQIRPVGALEVEVEAESDEDAINQARSVSLRVSNEIAGHAKNDQSFWLYLSAVYNLGSGDEILARQALPKARAKRRMDADKSGQEKAGEPVGDGQETIA